MDTLFGIPTQQLMWALLAVFGLGGAVLGFLALRDPVALKMAARNIPRRKAQTGLIVLGLMLATLLFSASFTTGDTLTNSIREESLGQIGQVDVVVEKKSPEAEDDFETQAVSRAAYFDEATAEDVRERLSENQNVAGVAPLATETVPVSSKATDLSEPAVDVLGMEAGSMRGFDGLTRASGERLSLDDLTRGEAYISEETAENLGVGVGDEVEALLGPRPAKLEVAGVYAEGGVPANSETSLVVPLAELQRLAGVEGKINSVIVTHEGPAVEGRAGTDATISDLKPLTEESGLVADPVKREALKQADETGAQFSSLFLVLGQFSIAAGVLLIFLIFVMLAAERKRELGIARAVGMQRGHLMRTFMLEGALYALVASAVGSVLGVGVGWVIARVFGQAIAGFDDSGFGITFAWSPENVVIAFVLGMVLTFGVVLISSWRVSRMNVVRAVRDIPEPDKKGRSLWGVILALATPLAGAAMTWQGLETEQMGLYKAGLSLLVVGVALISRILRLPDRVAFSLAGIGLLALWLRPFDLAPESMPDGGIEIFFLAGVMIVVGAVWICIFNADVLLRAIVAVFGRIRGLPPVLKTAVSYPMQNRFRTGTTLALFALIVFAVVTLSFTNESTAGIYEDTDTLSGGFEIRADAGYAAPIRDMDAALQNTEGVNPKDIAAVGGVSNLPVEAKQRSTDRESKDFTLQGVDDGYTGNVGYGFALTAPGYDSPREVWNALEEEKDTAVISASLAPTKSGTVIGPGPPLKLSGFYLEDEALPDDLYVTVKDPNAGAARDLRVIGVVEETAFNVGDLVTRQETLDGLAGIPVPKQSYFFDLKEGANAGATAKALEKGFARSGLQTTVMAEEIRAQSAFSNIFSNVLTGFMGLGLLVGIAALGVIAARSVVERRQQIGVLRALGFRKGQVRLAFLIESSFVALLGITLGVALGAALSYGLIDSLGEDLAGATYQVPWTSLTLIVGLSYAASLLTTYLPARQASRVYPAEALRYE